MSVASSYFCLDLELLLCRVRVQSTREAFLHDLATCFDDAVPRAGNAKGHAADLTITIDPDPTPRPSERGRWRITTDPANALPVKRLPDSNARSTLTSAITQWAVDNTNRHYVFHAGSVERDDRAILLPGSSRSGKTTLTAGLIRRGFRLLSDEVGAIDISSGRQVAYPRALSIRSDVGELLGLRQEPKATTNPESQSFVKAHELGATRATDAVPALVIAPTFDAAAPCRFERLSHGQAVISMMSCFCSKRSIKTAGLDFIIDLVRRVPCYELVFPDLAAALDRIEDAFEQATDETP